MARLICKFLVGKQFVSEKSGRAYVQGTDVENGQPLKIAFDSKQSIVAGQILDLDASVEVSEYRDKQGNVTQSLNVVKLLKKGE